MRLIRIALALMIGSVATARLAGAQSIPSLPGSKDSPPPWLKPKDVPFDLLAFFKMPPAGQNAAPLYLDALLDFDPTMLTCFPAGDPDARRRADAAKARQVRLAAFDEAIKAKQPVDMEAIDTLLAEYRPAFDKLSKAQDRPSCKFPIGISFDSPVPHAQAARQVARVSSLRAYSDLRKGEIRRPIRDMETSLRLARDLQARGVAICEVVTAAMLGYSIDRIALPILAHSKLQAEDCDSLLRAIEKHESNSIDGDSEALKSEYLLQRDLFRNALGRPDDPDRAAGALARQAFCSGPLVEILKLEGPDRDAKIAQFEQILASCQPVTERLLVSQLDKLYRGMAADASLPPNERVDRYSGLLNAMPKGDLARNLPQKILVEAQSDLPSLIHVEARMFAELRGAKTLIAVRRWQLTHAGANPPDLVAAVRAAGLKAVPVDPYDPRKPLKMATIGGKPVVYSIGRDGKDDGGRVDSDRGKKPVGDLIIAWP